MIQSFSLSLSLQSTSKEPRCLVGDVAIVFLLPATCVFTIFKEYELKPPAGLHRLYLNVLALGIALSLAVRSYSPVLRIESVVAGIEI